ncbi:MAG: hypothetical protein AB7K68_00175 [Bacteriovoracia bacterium]
MLQVIDSVLAKRQALMEIIPNPRNAFIEVALDKYSYATGERSQLVAHAINFPENQELEFVVSLKLDGQSQKTLEDAPGSRWRANSIRLSPGIHNWRAHTYIRNKRAASGFTAAINEEEARKNAYERQLKLETDPEEIERLNALIADTINRIQLLNEKLVSLQREVGTFMEIPVWVE